MKELFIIPEPKKISRREGKFLFDRLTPIWCSKELLSGAEDLIENFKSITTTLSFEIRTKVITGREGIHLQLNHKTKIGIENPESYRLYVDKERIWIESPTEKGIYYGCQTLLQLIKEKKHRFEIPCIGIEDYPDLSLRGVHIDLKCQMLRFDYIKEIIKKLAAYKINTILIEYEDKFPFEKHPTISSDGSLARDEIKELVKFAGRSQIQLIPLLQSLSHVEHILRHKEYRHLSEEGSFFQFCPLHPGSLELYKELFDEIVSLHPGPGYFHIGGDEAWALGSCRRCKRKVANVGKSNLFGDYINKVCKYVLRRGKIPIIWSDMVLGHPEVLDTLPQEVVIMEWDYYTKSPIVDRLHLWGTGKQYIEEEDVPEHLKKIFEKYWHVGSGGYRGFFYLKYLKERNRTTIVAPSIRCYGDSYISPDYSLHIPNINSSVRAGHNNGVLGVLLTSWVVRRTPWETTWPAIVYLSNRSWRASSRTKNNFKERFVYSFYGVRNRQLEKIPYLLSQVLALTFVADIYGRIKYHSKSNIWMKPPIQEEIKNLVKSPKLKNELRQAKIALNNSQRALKIIQRTLRQVPHTLKDNLFFWEYTAKMTVHKAKQLFLFVDIENYISIGDRNRKKTESLLSEAEGFKQELRKIKDLSMKALCPLLSKKALREEIQLRFQNEEKVINNYLRQMRS